MLSFDDFHDYQSYAIKEAMVRKKIGLFLETGLGKTIISLTVIDQLFKRRWGVGALVVAPKKVMYNVWRQEAKLWKHTEGLRINVIHGDIATGSSEKNKTLQLLEPAHIHLINYEGIPWLVKKLAALQGQINWPWDIVVFDESTKMKHQNSMRYKYFVYILKYFKYMYLLTGSPMPNSIMDLFGQMYLLDQGKALGKSSTSFKKKYMESYTPPGQQFPKWKAKKEAKSQVRALIQDQVVYLRKTDYLNLPKKHYTSIEFDFSKKVRKQYDELAEEFFLKIKGMEVEAFNEAAKSMKCRQFLQGYVYDATGSALFVHQEKLEMLDEMLEGMSDNNMLIVYNFKFERDALRSLKALAEAPAIDSRTSELDASRYIELWQRGKLPALLANSASIPFGLNLQRGGHHVLWYSLTWNFEHYDQLIDRLWRQGQDKPVFIHHLIARDTIDQVVYGALQSKDKNQRSLLDELRAYAMGRAA